MDQAAAERNARLAGLFHENEDSARSFGHEVCPSLFLANRHALAGAGLAWLADEARADAVVICAAELAGAAASLRASAIGGRLAVSLVEIDEYDVAKGSLEGYTARLRAQLLEAAGLARAQLEAGKRVVIACKYGYNRSASVALALLSTGVGAGAGAPLLESLERLRVARPKVYPNFESWPALLVIERESGALQEDGPAGGALSLDELERFHAWSPRNRKKIEAVGVSSFEAHTRTFLGFPVRGGPSRSTKVLELTLRDARTWRLFVGNAEAALDVLETGLTCGVRVSHVVNAAAAAEPTKYFNARQGVMYVSLVTRDWPEPAFDSPERPDWSPILRLLEASLRDVQTRESNVFVHCAWGLNRSVSSCAVMLRCLLANAPEPLRIESFDAAIARIEAAGHTTDVMRVYSAWARDFLGEDVAGVAGAGAEARGLPLCRGLKWSAQGIAEPCES
jgi:protein-tyrosine phosphatase